MMRRAPLLGFVFAALVACSSGGSGGGTVAPPAPQGEVVGTTGLDVKIAFSAASLGDEGCNSGAGLAPSGGACAAPSNGTSDRAPGSGICGGCRATTMQIAFTTTASGSAAKVQVVSVSLYDASTNLEVGSLSSTAATVWDATTSTYKAWDGTLTPSEDVKASYTLTSPQWSKLDPSYTKKYKLEVTLLVDGTTFLLESEELNREPAVAT
jgi:hypothetical protein